MFAIILYGLYLFYISSKKGLLRRMGEINRTSKPGLSYAVLGLRYHLVILSERLYALDMGDMRIASFSGPTFISSSRGKQKQNNNSMLLY